MDANKESYSHAECVAALLSRGLRDGYTARGPVGEIGEVSILNVDTDETMFDIYLFVDGECYGPYTEEDLECL
jgi:hypothetical protein